MHLTLDGTVDSPEIEIVGTPSEYVELGRSLVDLKLPLTVVGEQEDGDFRLNGLRFDVGPKGGRNQLLNCELQEGWLVIDGGPQAISNLGQSFVNFFSSATSGEHFHLDYYEGDYCVLAPTTCHLIFVCH